MGIEQSISNHSGSLFAAWKGEVGDDRLFYSRFNGTMWSPATTIGGNSSVGPALAGLGNSLFAAWKGEHSDERLFFTKLIGDTWAPQELISGAASSVGPSLSNFGTRLYAAWKGSGSDQSLWYASFDGTKWSAQAQIQGTASSVGPSLCAFGGKLYAAWKGSGNDQSLWYAPFDGTKWSTQAQIPGTASSVGPSLCAFGGKLYAAWKGSSNDQSLWYASFNGIKWSVQANIPGVASSIGPALAEFDGKLYAMWKGSSNDQSLWYASFDGTKWSTQAKIPGNTGQDLPQNIGLRMQFQESGDWCWIAVATSINHFYNPASTVTQCALVTPIGHSDHPENCPSNTSACPSPAAIASVPGLAAILTDPYSMNAQNALENPGLGILRGYLNMTGGVGDPLKLNGNAQGYPGQGSVTLDQITSEIAAGRPIAVDIAWKSGSGQHCIAIAGVLDDMLLICDPFYGESVIQYESFPSSYQGGATLVGVNLTKPA
jgi:hypothetical protein